MPKCPRCGRTKTWRGGGQVTSEGKMQRYICTNCGHVWVSDEPYIKKTWIPMTQLPKTESPEKLKLKDFRRRNEK